MTDLGERPQLAWVDIDELFIEKSYQRSAERRTSQRAIAKMGREFSWALFQPITIAPRRGKKGYNVVDGQHRLLGAIAHGGVDELPCWIIAADCVQDEAGHFIGLNKNRVRMHTVDMYHASLAADAIDETDISRVIAKAGVTICKTPMRTEDMPPGETMAIGSIRTGLNRHGEDPVVAALKTLKKAYAGMKGMLRSQIITAMIGLYAANAEKKIDEKRLIQALNDNPPDTLEEMARANKKLFGNSTSRGMIAVLVRAYNKGLSKQNCIAEAA
jgi:hypothetical protein